MDPPPRVMGAIPLLLVCDFNAHGGTQTQILELLAAIRRDTFRPHLCTLSLDAALSSRLAALDVPLRDLALERAFSPHTFSAIARTSDYVRDEGIRLIHGFLLNGNLAAAAVGRRSGVPYLTSVRNLELWKRPHELLASRWAHGSAAAVTFNSRHVRDLVARRESIPLDRTRVIPNGLRSEERPSDHGGWPGWTEPRLICAASLFPKKGHPYLLEALSRVVAAHPTASLLLAGHGPERGTIESKVKALGLSERVIFAGYRADARTLIASARVFLLSSIEEGLPNVILEALSAGVPQVATAAGGTVEAVEEGVTGFVVPPRDPVLMAERILRLLDDPSLHSRMAAASRERFERLFRVERMSRDHEALYGEVLGAAA